MIKERLNKVGKILAILGAKQIWGLGCNLYLLTYQPYLTIKTIIETKDIIQIILIIMAALFPGLVYITARIAWDTYRYGYILTSVGNIFLITVLIEALIWGYLMYWTYKVLKKL